MWRKAIIGIVFGIWTIGNLTQAQANTDKLSAPLRLLRAAHGNPAIWPNFIRAEAQAPDINVSVSLAPGIDPAACQGILWRRVSGEWAGANGIYGARMTWDEIDRWSQDARVRMIASDWHPKVVPCLDVSAPEVGAPEAWSIMTPQGWPITGIGQLVADFDTGIDVFHPAFFRPSGDLYEWLDVDGNNEFTSGTDVVDLNRNHIGEREELLRFLDGQIYDVAMTFGGDGHVSNADNVFQSDWDWLYNDADDNGERDYGSPAGFAETDPGYGEKVFYGEDANGNHDLDVGEQLNMLGASKISAVMDSSGIRRRGIDLIFAEPDYDGHGTAVSGILAGGEPDRSRFCGLAPGADLLMGYTSAVGFEDYLPWVRSEGCKVLLYEFGGWVFLPLDGSTNEELLLNSEAAQGVMQVTPSGNLNRGYKHCQLQIASGADVPVHIGANTWQGVDPSWFGCTFLWREPAIEFALSLEDPYGYSVDLAANDSLQVFGDWYVWSGIWVSPRGTAEYDISLWGQTGEPIIGTWTLTLHHPGGAAQEVNGYVADNASAWEGGAEFNDYRSTDHTVTWPATADSAFVLGSYSTRGYEQYIGVGSGSISPGEISKFSGRGTRIDGVHLLSLAAPGNYDVYSARSVTGDPFTHGGWRQFSGTSAAGPHVAAAAVLALAADPGLTRREIEDDLEAYAYQDSFTGSGYNDTWGYGKVRIGDMVGYLVENVGVSTAPVGTELPATLSLKAYPNPFNETVSMRVDLDADKNVEILVFDVLGRQVDTIFRGRLSAGTQKITWDAKSVPAGVYWAQMSAEGARTVKKVVVLK